MKALVRRICGLPAKTENSQRWRAMLDWGSPDLMKGFTGKNDHQFGTATQDRESGGAQIFESQAGSNYSKERISFVRDQDEYDK